MPLYDAVLPVFPYQGCNNYQLISIAYRYKSHIKLSNIKKHMLNNITM